MKSTNRFRNFRLPELFRLVRGPYKADINATSCDYWPNLANKINWLRVFRCYRQGDRFVETTVRKHNDNDIKTTFFSNFALW